MASLEGTSRDARGGPNGNSMRGQNASICRYYKEHRLPQKKCPEANKGKQRQHDDDLKHMNQTWPRTTYESWTMVFVLLRTRGHGIR